MLDASWSYSALLYVSYSGNEWYTSRHLTEDTCNVISSIATACKTYVGQYVKRVNQSKQAKYGV